MRISDWSSDVCSSDLPDIWRAETGVRSILLPDRLEGWALGGYEDSDVASGDLYARFGVQYKLDKAWGVVAEAKFINGDEQYFIGPRLSFGSRKQVATKKPGFGRAFSFLAKKAVRILGLLLARELHMKAPARG